MKLVYLMGAALGFIYLNVFLVRFRQAIPYLVILAVTFYYVYGDPKVSLGIVNVRHWDVVFFLAAINVAYFLLFRKDQWDANTKRVLFFFLAFFGLLGFAEVYYFVFSPDDLGLDSLVRNFTRATYPILLLSVFVNLKPDEREKFVEFAAWCAMVIAAWTLTREVLDIGSWKTSSGTIRRIKGEAVIILHFGFLYFLYAKHRFKPKIRYPMIALGAVAVALAGHRSGFLSVGTTMILYTIYLTRSDQLKTSAMLAIVPAMMFGGALLLGVAVFGKSQALEGFIVRASDTFNAENKTSEDRLYKWKIALRSTLDNPFGGTKMNLQPDFYGKYALEADYGDLSFDKQYSVYLFREGLVDPFPPHNMFINIASRNGIPALVLFLTLVIVTYRRFIRTGNLNEKYAKLSAVVGTLVFLSFNNEHSYDANVSLYLAILVMPLCYRAIHQSQGAPTDLAVQDRSA